jgi:transmembrane sensor
MTLTESDEGALLRAQAEAAAWMALLHSPDRSPELEAGLRRWIAADPLHAATWEAATDLWNETGDLPRRIPRRRLPEQARSKPPIKPLFAVAALCLLAIGALVQYSLPSAVTTSVGEQRTLNLDDGTRVELNTNSRLRVKFDRQNRTVVLESGEAYFQVAHERRPFIVLAGERKIVALGTAFTVRRDEISDDAVTVTLIEGRVAVAPANTDNKAPAATPAVTVLKAGQRLRTRPDATSTVDAPSIDKATGWMRGQLIFDHTPLREAAAEFSRYNKIKITVTSPQAATIPIGGIFRIGDSRSFARAVAASYDLKVTQRGNELILEPTGADSPAPNNVSPDP